MGNVHAVLTALPSLTANRFDTPPHTLDSCAPDSQDSGTLCTYVSSEHIPRRRYTPRLHILCLSHRLCTAATELYGYVCGGADSMSMSHASTSFVALTKGVHICIYIGTLLGPSPVQGTRQAAAKANQVRPDRLEKVGIAPQSGTLHGSPQGPGR